MDSGADDSDDDSGSMDDVSVSMEENLNNDDLHAGTPLYGSTMGDVDPKSPSLMGTHGKSQAVSHGQSPQESPPVMEEVMEKSQSVMVKPWDESW
jgi:hypothetical protein